MGKYSKQGKNDISETKIVSLNEIISPVNLNVMAFMVQTKKKSRLAFFQELIKKAEKYEKTVKSLLGDGEKIDSAPIYMEENGIVLNAFMISGLYKQDKKEIECYIAESKIDSELMERILDIFQENEKDYLILEYIKMFNPSCRILAQKSGKIRFGKTIRLNKGYVEKTIRLTANGYKNIKSLYKGIGNIQLLENTETVCFRFEMTAGRKEKNTCHPFVNVVFNRNSLEMLNKGKPLYYKNFLKKLGVYRKMILEKGYCLDDFVVVSSAVLGFYALREPTDIDYITVVNDCKDIKNIFIDNHMHVIHTYEKTAEEMIYVPDNYLFFGDIKILAKEAAKKACRNRSELIKKMDEIMLEYIDKIPEITMAEKLFLLGLNIMHKNAQETKGKLKAIRKYGHI